MCERVEKSFGTDHCEIDAAIVLKSIQQPDEPFALRVCEDISLGQNMPDLIHLKQQLLAHDFQRADFTCVFLLCQIDLTITPLTDLG